jgi:FMN-dependent oxidoreductase (nitrilotriacetate monooxygenase family)
MDIMGNDNAGWKLDRRDLPHSPRERPQSMAPKFHLGWFGCFNAVQYDTPFSTTESPFDGKFYVEMAQTLERACFDYLLIEDTLMVPDLIGGTFDAYLKRGSMAPKHDPIPLSAVLGAATRYLGVVATMSTSFYPPYMLARVSATLDHLTDARFGWNVVTSAEDSAAQNFGMDKMLEHDRRYEIADEYMDLVHQLWSSWDPDALVIDHESGTYVKKGSVRSINFEGEFFRSRGPLNTLPPINGRPVIVQAGGSPRGRAFAAKHADSIITVARGVEKMKAYRDDVRARAEAYGRKPDDIKVLYVVNPVVAETTDEAHAKNTRMHESDRYVEESLLIVSSITDIDLSQFPLDEPLPPGLKTNGEQTALDVFCQEGSGKTLRQLAQEGINNSIEFVGTPDEVAVQMGEAMEEVGGDGFLLSPGALGISRKYLNEIADGLVPALQRRGLVRTSYTHDHLIDNLQDF